ncbi:MAG: class I SAM-dependent methyltransferase [Mariprofundales bacterium]
MNNFLEFYGKHNISPVSQNIENLENHFQRRIGLYRTLGLTPSLFKGSDILEIAPGSGHNSIVTATFGSKSYDLLEPNTAGFNQMLKLFKLHQLNNHTIRCFNQRLEDFMENKAYDIVLCEGLIPGLSNHNTFINQLASKVRPGGILVVTCADAVSVFFETLRRYLARILVSQSEIGLETPKSAAHIAHFLSNTFAQQLSTLKGMSRPIDDWIWDNLLNPAAASLPASNEFSIENCINILGEDFYFFGSSPTCMTNWEWYKNLSTDSRKYNEPFLDSFTAQRVNFLHYMESCSPNTEDSQSIYHYCKQFSSRVEMIDPINPGLFNANLCYKDLKPIHEILKIVSSCGLKKSTAALSEFIHLFDKSRLPTPQTVSEMKSFSEAFGRGQQYVSLVRCNAIK